VLAYEHIEKLIKSGKRARVHLKKDEKSITELDIQKALGELDKVKYDLEAAQILLRLELKDRRGKELSNGQ
jgi:hypothetical protein